MAKDHANFGVRSQVSAPVPSSPDPLLILRTRTALGKLLRGLSGYPMGFDSQLTIVVSERDTILGADERQHRGLMEERRLQLLNEIKQRAVNFGTFVLSSGQTSHYYLDCRLVTLSPFGAWLTANAFLDTFEGIALDAVGGMSVAADPIAAAIAVESWHRSRPLRGFIVRKEAKGHGMQRQVEGPLQRGDRVAVVDDVLTTGGSILQAIDAVEAAGATVVLAAVILDRLQGGGEKIRERGYTLHSLFTLDDIRDYLEAQQPAD